jgi:hypothetical protein
MFKFELYIDLNIMTESYHEVQYETTISGDEDQLLMMSRLNWMTYIKVLFDKLTSTQHLPINSPPSSNQEVDLYQLMEALSQIKNLLPLQSKDEYSSKHGHEKGFTVQEVELNLRRFLIMNRGSSKLTWDDVIDMFLANKFQALNVT